MDKHHVAALLEETAKLLELKGENLFKVRAYENAARVVDDLTFDLGELAAKDELTSIKGIGKNLAEHIAEIIKTGDFGEHKELRASIPDGVIQMLLIPGLGPRRVHHIWEKLKIKTPGELELACKRGMLVSEPGFGEKLVANILSGIESLKRFAGKRLYSEALAIAEGVLDEIKKWPEVARAEIGGSLRRRREIVKDIDILVSTKKSERVMEKFVNLPAVEKILQHGETKSEVFLKYGIQCDLRAVKDKEYPFALHYFTGSKEHNIAVRALAKKAGYKLNEYGLFKGDPEKSVLCKDEAALFKMLGLEYIEPELREDTGEIEAAMDGKLPKLIEDKDVKGVIHCHTTYTDGADTIGQMASAAKEMGYKYIAICDHSQSVTIANGLKPRAVAFQHKEIDELNSKMKNFMILKGVEVDILADGSLDYDDKILSTFDVVIAAVHSRFGMAEKEMTARIIKAIENPNVDILAHPTGRLLLSREPYAVDLKAVIDAAARCKKAIEINAHPQRLDLDWRFCKYAKEKGVKIVICPDAHSVEGIRDIAYGVGIARKGWLEKKDVLNCLGVKEFVERFSHLVIS